MTEAPERINVSKSLGGQWVAFDNGYGEDYVRADIAEAREAKLLDALWWYGEQARLARLIHGEGDVGRLALSEDGGSRARAIIAELEKP